ncbi:MAG TPA: AraC family transcriptional regulator [Verrucomicrobiae bacterium]
MNTRLKYLEEHEWLKLAQQAEWSVSRLAKLCSVSVRGLELYFHAKIGRTPKKWLVEQRQKQAVILLLDGYLVKEVSSQLAYKQPNHFSREFKRQIGYCPTQINPIGPKTG